MQESQYTRSLIEASLDPLLTINTKGKITHINQATVDIIGMPREKIIDTDFYYYFTDTVKAKKVYLKVFAKGNVSDCPLTLQHKKGKFTDVCLYGNIYKDDHGKVMGAVMVARNVMAQKMADQYARSLIEASLDPLFTISPTGKITDLNNASVNITGISRQKSIGTDFFKYFTEPEMAREAYQQVFARGFISDFSLAIKDRMVTDVLCNGSVYKDEQGNVIGVVIVARDITDQKRKATELLEAKVAAEEAKMKAEDAVKAKQQFLSNMSHEIRTPMNAIIGFTKVMLKTKLTANQKKYLTAVKMSGDALIVIINDILDLAKVNSGKMTFEQTPFKMGASISTILDLFEAKIKEKNLKLIKLYDKEIPEVLVGDQVRLHQVILNLMSNALKFTSKGKITVSVHKVSDDEHTATLEFAVSDTGIGIPENKTNQIFEIFQQASGDTARLYGGTGLGLAIVKQLVELQGGSIQVKSKPGEGSTFSFILTFQKTIEEADSDNEIMELDKEIKDLKVLVVEDTALNQLLMETLLTDFGFECDIADNGKIAIEKLSNKAYDIILMDLQMPVMNGIEATAYVRNKMGSTIPIIALTADVTTVDLAKCNAIGMNDYVSKPIDEKVLYHKIVELVKNPSVLPTANESEKENTADEKVRTTNLDYLLYRTHDDKKFTVKVIAIFLRQTPVLISELKKGVIEKNWDQIHKAVNKLLPLLSAMGIVSEVENIAKKVQEYSMVKDHVDEINRMTEQLEEVCKEAGEELEETLKIYQPQNE